MAETFDHARLRTSRRELKRSFRAIDTGARSCAIAHKMKMSRRVAYITLFSRENPLSSQQ